MFQVVRTFVTGVHNADVLSVWLLIYASFIQFLNFFIIKNSIHYIKMSILHTHLHIVVSNLGAYYFLMYCTVHNIVNVFVFVHRTLKGQCSLARGLLLLAVHRTLEYPQNMLPFITITKPS